MISKEILQKYLDFFSEKGHKRIPNVSLVPENDPTLLFVNSGMFPLVPYLSGQQHPLGKRLMNVQRCLRTIDIENVGNTNRHTTAFHMIGNWSLGDYFKKEQLKWKYEFFIEHLGLDPQKIYATVFSGNEKIEKDYESVELLKEIFNKYGIDAKEGERIFETPKDNWWQRGEAIGELGGPSSEIFYYIGSEGSGLGQNILENEQDFIEIGNSVFMQYQLTQEGWIPLEQKNIDFGGGLERIALAVQGKKDIYETDNFQPIIKKIEQLTGKTYGNDSEDTKMMRILADHIRSSMFLAMDGVKPSNVDQGYILRRLLRRMVRAGRKLGIPVDVGISVSLVGVVTQSFDWLYPELSKKQAEIEEIFSQEEKKFQITLNQASKKVLGFLDEFSQNNTSKQEIYEVLSQASFDFYQSLGYPIEIFIDDVLDYLKLEDPSKVEEGFNKLVSEHKEKSREGAREKFEGGLADHSNQTIKYHTATHLLHWALRQVLGEEVSQKGSNITNERLRFDFSFNRKMTDEEIDEVQNLINQKAGQDIPVNFVVLPKEEAEKTGALHFFGEKYGEKVKVYFIGETLEDAFSKEFCGGPHIQNLNELGNFEIFKQKSIGENVLRVYLREV